MEKSYVVIGEASESESEEEIDSSVCLFYILTFQKLNWISINKIIYIQFIIII